MHPVPLRSGDRPAPVYPRRYRLADLARDLGIGRGYQDLVLYRIVVWSPELADETARWLVDGDRRAHPARLGRLRLPAPPGRLLLRLHRERMRRAYAHGVRLGQARATDRLIREATAICPVDPRDWTVIRPLAPSRRDRSADLQPDPGRPLRQVALPPAMRDHATTAHGAPRVP